MTKEKICFVISPIGDLGSETRKRADQVLKHIIEPAAAKCGYTALRSDKIAEPGNITSQVIQHILEDPMLIADISGSNGNVFYELALRHAIKKPFVQMISDNEKIPFDVSGMRTVIFNHRDLDSAQAAREEIEQQIKAVEKKSPDQIETPVTVAIDLQTMKQGTAEQRSIAELFKAVSDIRNAVGSIQGQITSMSRTPEIMKFSYSPDVTNALLGLGAANKPGGFFNSTAHTPKLDALSNILDTANAG